MSNVSATLAEWMVSSRSRSHVFEATTALVFVMNAIKRYGVALLALTSRRATDGTVPWPTPGLTYQFFHPRLLDNYQLTLPTTVLTASSGVRTRLHVPTKIASTYAAKLLKSFAPSPSSHLRVSNVAADSAQSPVSAVISSTTGSSLFTSPSDSAQEISYITFNRQPPFPATRRRQAHHTPSFDPKQLFISTLRFVISPYLRWRFLHPPTHDHATNYIQRDTDRLKLDCLLVVVYHLCDAISIIWWSATNSIGADQARLAMMIDFGLKLQQKSLFFFYTC